MKTHYRILFIATFGIILVKQALGQGSIIIQHSGAANPTTEGFTLAETDSYAIVGPVINDMGMNAWNTTVSNNSPDFYYTYSLTPEQQSETVGVDWTLSFVLRDLESSAAPNAFIGLTSFGMYIGLETNGDPFVDGPRDNPIYVLNGGGGGYHNYQIVYTAATGTIALWIDGVERVSNFSAVSVPAGISQIEFGEGQGGHDSDNWNLVSFEIVPEPPAASLIFLGGGVLIYVRTRIRR